MRGGEAKGSFGQCAGPNLGMDCWSFESWYKCSVWLAVFSSSFVSIDSRSSFCGGFGYNGT